MDSFWWLGVILWLVPFIASGLLMIQSQMKLIKLYRRKQGISDSVVDELIQKYSTHPIRWLIESPNMSWVMFRLSWQKFSDKELDNAANKVQKYFWLTLAIMFLLFSLPIIFSSLN